MTAQPTGRGPLHRTRRAALAAGLAAAVAGTAAFALHAGDSGAQDGAPPLRYEGSITAPGGLLLGAAVSAGPGETWAARSGRALDGSPQQFLLRYRDGEGWRPAESALDEQGQPYAGGTVLDGRVTPQGGLLLVADDEQRPAGLQRVVMTRGTEGPARVLVQPGEEVLAPQDGSIPAETLSAQALAARDDATGTEAFLAISGRPLQTGIARWAGGTWRREAICVAADVAGTPPTGCTADETLTRSHGGLTVVALAAAPDGGPVWALARAVATAERGLVLFARVEDGDGVRWVLREIGAPLFETAATPARAVTDAAPLDSGAALTATADGLWIDGTFAFRTEPRDVTIFLDRAGPTSWCDAADTTGPLCDHPLGIDLHTRQQSIAWPGPARFGRRAIGTLSSGPSRQLFYATLEGDRFELKPSFAALGARMALSAPDKGWIGGTRVTRDPATSTLAAWPVPLRRPLTAIAAAPEAAPGAVGSAALAVGMNGSILRYTPGQGWDSEALLASGGIATPNLRGVAWPTQEFAYAVGDDGAMWRWRRVTNLWEPDPAAPFDFVGNLTAIAFQPGNPNRGYAVGRGGVILRYGKSWEAEPAPAEVQTTGPLGGPADITSVAFAGAQALAVAGRDVLVDNGAGWSVDAGARDLLARTGGRPLRVVAGLPDGGAVAAGDGIVIARDRLDAPWRLTGGSVPGVVVAAAAFREGDAVRALVSVTGGSQYPLGQETNPPVVDPTQPPPRLSGFTPPGDGYLLRETATGWRDEDRSALGWPESDPAVKRDPILALLTDATGSGWAVGGWSNLRDTFGRGTDASQEPLIEDYETSSVARYDPAAPQGSPNLRTSQVPTAPGAVRFLVGGGARCNASCAALAPAEIGPDRTLTRALELANRLHTQPDGPRALLYTGGRARVAGAAEQRRFAQLMGTATLPLLPAVAEGEALGGGSGDYEAAFAGFPAPLGEGAPPAGLLPVALGAGAAPGRARTHYAVDTGGDDGTVRVVVIDNASGSLEARDATGNPVEPGGQAEWLRTVLADARRRGIVSIVVGNRSLRAGEQDAASDADAVAAILRDNGASAYLYERPGQYRSAIPLNGGEVPAFASGSLGYRNPRVALYDIPGLLLLDVDVARRDPTTGRAPVTPRLIPVIDELALEAVDGRVLNRSQPALMQGLGRRPRSGDVDSNQFVALPERACAEGACPERIAAEVRFTSSDPDIADFVRIDATSPNPRKPFVDPATDKVVADTSSALLCAFNAGTTTVTVEAGGLSYSTTVTVRDGSVLRPCGTMPLNPSRFPTAPPSRQVVAPPTVPPRGDPPKDDPPPTVVPPPLEVEEPAPAARPTHEPQPVRPRPTPERQPPPEAPAQRPEPNPLPTAPVTPALIPLSVPPPSPTTPRPIPPSGTSPVTSSVTLTSPVAQVERQREEEEALEQSQAYARVTADHRPGGTAVPLAALVLLAAVGGVAIRRPRRDRRHRCAYAEGGASRSHRIDRVPNRRFHP